VPGVAREILETLENNLNFKEEKKFMFEKKFTQIN